MKRVGLVSSLFLCGLASGQAVRLHPLPTPTPLPQPGGGGAVPAAAVTVLGELAARAGAIFAGHVLEVQRNEGAGYVDVVFAVDRPVRGCAGAKRYVLREWAGLWAEEPQRYGVGQRLLMILAARGPSGMSAPVGGMAGKIPLVGVRQPPLARATGIAPADTEDRLEEAVDLRWVEAAALRTTAPGARARAEARKSEGWAGPVRPLPPAPAGAAAPGLSAVLAVLSGR